jgi:hypothetical protein
MPFQITFTYLLMGVDSRNSDNLQIVNKTANTMLQWLQQYQL